MNVRGESTILRALGVPKNYSFQPYSKVKSIGRCQTLEFETHKLVVLPCNGYQMMPYCPTSNDVM